MASADLLLHPVRLRIVQAFLGGRALTTGALAAELPDVPAATLYRQVGRLADAGVLQVVAEQPVRGGVQRTYVLRASAAVVTPDQIAGMSRDDLRQAFLSFVAGLLGDVDRYLARDPVDPVRDGASFRLAGLWLDDAEFAALLAELVRVLRPAAANPPRPGRKRRILATVLLPAEDAVGPAGDAAGLVGDAAGPAEDAAGLVGDAAGPAEDAAGLVGDAAGPAEDAAGLVGDAVGPAEDAAGLVGDAAGLAGADAASPGLDAAPPAGAGAALPGVDTAPDAGAAAGSGVGGVAVPDAGVGAGGVAGPDADRAGPDRPGETP